MTHSWRRRSHRSSQYELEDYAALSGPNESFETDKAVERSRLCETQVRSCVHEGVVDVGKHVTIWEPQPYNKTNEEYLSQ